MRTVCSPMGCICIGRDTNTTNTTEQRTRIWNMFVFVSVRYIQQQPQPQQQQRVEIRFEWEIYNINMLRNHNSITFHKHRPFQFFVSSSSPSSPPPSPSSLCREWCFCCFDTSNGKIRSEKPFLMFFATYKMHMKFSSCCVVCFLFLFWNVFDCISNRILTVIGSFENVSRNSHATTHEFNIVIVIEWQCNLWHFVWIFFDIEMSRSRLFRFRIFEIKDDNDDKEEEEEEVAWKEHTTYPNDEEQNERSEQNEMYKNRITQTRPYYHYAEHFELCTYKKKSDEKEEKQFERKKKIRHKHMPRRMPYACVCVPISFCFHILIPRHLRSVVERSRPTSSSSSPPPTTTLLLLVHFSFILFFCSIFRCVQFLGHYSLDSLELHVASFIWNSSYVPYVRVDQMKKMNGNRICPSFKWKIGGNVPNVLFRFKIMEDPDHVSIGEHFPKL